MNEYQREQLSAWRQIKQALAQMSTREISAMRKEIEDYLCFRKDVDLFLNKHFNNYCTIHCYQNNRSACCSKDGILIFWADLVIDAISSDTHPIENILKTVQAPVHSDKCIYLSHDGCCWQIRPLVCVMFLCDAVQQAVFAQQPEVGRQWEEFCKRARAFRWPDKSVLFDRFALNVPSHQSRIAADQKKGRVILILECPYQFSIHNRLVTFEAGDNGFIPIKKGKIAHQFMG